MPFILTGSFLDGTNWQSTTAIYMFFLIQTLNTWSGHLAQKKYVWLSVLLLLMQISLIYAVKQDCWQKEIHSLSEVFLKPIIQICLYLFIFYLFGVLCRFQHCTGHITTGSWKGRGNQYIQFIRVLYCKLLTNGKQLPAFPLEAVPGTEPRPQRWEARVLPLYHHGPSNLIIVSIANISMFMIRLEQFNWICTLSFCQIEACAELQNQAVHLPGKHVINFYLSMR